MIKEYIVIKKFKIDNDFFIAGEKIEIKDSDQPFFTIRRTEGNIEWKPEKLHESEMINLVELTPLFLTQIIRRGHFENWLRDKSNYTEIDDDGNSVTIEKKLPADYVTALLFSIQELKLSVEQLINILYQ